MQASLRQNAQVSSPRYATLRDLKVKMDPLYQYKNRVLELNMLFEYAKNLVSRFDIQDDATWYQRAAVLAYQESVDTAGIALSYLPESPVRSEIKSFSPQTLASQTRILVDNYLTIGYLLAEKDQEEASLQKLVWDQAIDRKRYEMVNQFNPNNPRIEQIEQSISQRKDKIESHALFSNLDDDSQNNCSNGFRDKIYKNGEMVERLELDDDAFWSQYKHYSQFVHSTAFASDQLEAFRRGREGGLQFVSTMVSNLEAIFSMNTLEVSEGFGVSSSEIPLSVLNILLFWKDAMQGNMEDPGPRPDAT
jgi:hypothetical protein